MFETLSKNRNFLLDESTDDEGGEGGIALNVEQLNAYLLAALNQDRRQRADGQKKFGVCPVSVDPNSLLVGKKTQTCGFGESPERHPLLDESQQFSGVAPKLTAIPHDNTEASERFLQDRLENQLRKNLGLGRRKSVSLVR